MNEITEALKVIADFQRDPDGARATLNRARGLEDRPFVRDERELDAAIMHASSGDLQALHLLADRLDGINRQVVAALPRALNTDDQLAFEWKSIQRVGVYVPKRLPATAYTYFAAAKAAGTVDLIAYLVQDESGEVDPLSAAAAKRYGVKVLVGPARLGFPALAMGLPETGGGPVQLVCGPCGQRMNILKSLACLIGGASTDMAAGPSTIAVIADESAPWARVLLSLASQLEHGPDSRADIILIGSDAVAAWERAAPPEALRIRVKAHAVNDVTAAATLTDAISPETVEIWARSGEHVARQLRACGIVYVGGMSALGDYGAIGRGCADPTDGMARAQSGLSPLTFMRLQPIVSAKSVDPQLRRAASTIAAYERLSAHREAIDAED
jgi:histidinol dehydrogenase